MKEPKFNVPVYFFKSLDYKANTNFAPEDIDDHLEDLIISFNCVDLKSGKKSKREVLYTGKDLTVVEVVEAVNLNGEDINGLCIDQNIELEDCLRVMDEIEDFGIPRQIISSEMIKNVIKKNVTVI